METTIFWRMWELTMVILVKKSMKRLYDFITRIGIQLSYDRRNLETSRTLYYDEAVNIIKDGLVIINDLCTNW